MKLYIKHILVFSLFISLFASCKDEVMSEFAGKDGIAFYYVSGLEQDSISFSFRENKTQQEKDTLFVKMRLIGKPEKRDRQIQVTSTTGTTAIEGTHFLLPKITLPADSFMVKYPVILLNHAELSTKAVRLVLKVVPTDDLDAGSVGLGNTNLFKINFSNQLIKPDYWSYIQGYLGVYSNVKYQFMIDVMGTSNFRPTTKGGTITYGEFLNFNSVLKNALDEYEKIHGPLIDENGLRVTFPR